jgi:integrase
MAEQQGNIYETRTGVGIRWREGSQRRYQSGFKNKTQARKWFRENVAPRLHRGAPSADITFNEFCELFLTRHAAAVSGRTVQTIRERLAPARAVFGDWKLRELEHAAADIAGWRETVPEGSRYRLMLALRQCLGAAVRWGYLTRNPARDAGPNPEPRAEELRPFTREQVDMLAQELGPVYGPLAVFAAETGLRTNEFVATERRDIDRSSGVVLVQRRFSDGQLTAYPKTQRRGIPLTDRALDAVENVPPRLDTPLLFPAPMGGHIGLDTWRTREWYPALEAAGIEQRGPYHLRHTFATEALAAGVSIFELSRLMGASVKVIDRTYGHLAVDTADAIRARLNARNSGMGVSWASAPDE